MVTKLMTTVVAPFDKTQLQDVLSRNMQRKKMEIREHRQQRKLPLVPTRFYVSRKNLSSAEKLQLRRERNRILAVSSRMRAKHEENHLKERLLQLEYETMKLLLENEALKRQNTKLEKEHQNLKSKVQRFCHKSMVKGNNVEATFKHASFVNISLQKEWVLLTVFLTIVMSIWEAMKQKAINLNHLMVYVNKHLYLNRCRKQKLNLDCFPLKFTMHLPAPQHIPLMPSG